MTKFYPVILLILFLLPAANAITNAQVYNSNNIDTAAVRSIVNEINKDSVKNIIQTLQNFGTRFMSNPNRRQIYKWIKNKFISYGFTDITIDSFYCNTTWNQLGLTTQYNVIAKLPGAVYSDQYYIIGGHYDSYSNGSVYMAPGADDNASGTAAVLESARVIKKKNYIPASTLLFIAFAAEELMNYGDSGSEHYASSARKEFMNIRMMINNDMILNSPYNLASSSVKINPYTGSENLSQFAMEMTSKYTVLTPTTGTVNQMSDSYPFYSSNYQAVYFEEKNFSSFYHTASDLLSNYNIGYCTEIIKASCATLVSYMESTVNITRDDKLPGGFVLWQNYPNPFNPVTTIKYTLPKTEMVTIKVFDMLGREMQTLVEEEKSPGIHQVEFNGSNLSSGTYFYKMAAGNFCEIKKFILLK